MVIRDVDGQVEKALNEIQMRYSRGMEFTIYDLMATSACIDAQNFDAYKIKLEIRISNRGVAGFSGTRNGAKLFRIIK